MNVSATAGSNQLLSQMVGGYARPEATEATRSGPDGDRDSDDRRVPGPASNTTPTVNLYGQTIGQNINVKA